MFGLRYVELGLTTDYPNLKYVLCRKAVRVGEVGLKVNDTAVVMRYEIMCSSRG